MKIAVLMSTYNGENFLKEQINSILAQEGGYDITLVIRDDGSSDQTISILNEYNSDDRIVLFSGDNLGAARSFIELIYNTKGFDYYFLADQDDYWDKNKIAAAILKMEKAHELNQPLLYVGNADLVDKELRSLGRKVYKKNPKLDFETLLCAGGLLGCTMAYNSDLAMLIQKEIKPENIVMHDFWLAIACKVLNGEIIYDNNSYLKYRQHGKNTIGVSHGYVSTIKDRVNDITTKMEPGISEQASELLKLHSQNYKDWITVVSNYKKSTINRLRLACSRKTKYIDFNISLKLRLSIALGNR